MTGEVTITGRVLPVGGIKEKFLAAYREGVKTILYPHTNVKDVSELPERVRKELTLIPVKHMDEVLPLALEGWAEFEAKLNKKRGHKKAAKKAKSAPKAAKSASKKVKKVAKTVKRAAVGKKLKPAKKTVKTAKKGAKKAVLARKGSKKAAKTRR